MLCNVNYESPADLQIHFNSDHLKFRDGNDLRCPRKNCNKAFPNRLSLKNHLGTHFSGGNAAVTNNEDPALILSPSEVVADASKRVAANGTVDHNHSPDAPEATHTVAGDSAAKQETQDGQATDLPCHLCTLRFGDATQLQTHWILEHLPHNQLSNLRTHICVRCDAGFTTADALRLHAETHQ
jgi:hypothetical protein